MKTLRSTVDVVSSSLIVVSSESSSSLDEISNVSNESTSDSEEVSDDDSEDGSDGPSDDGSDGPSDDGADGPSDDGSFVTEKSRIENLFKNIAFFFVTSIFFYCAFCWFVRVPIVFSRLNKRLTFQAEDMKNFRKKEKTRFFAEVRHRVFFMGIGYPILEVNFEAYTQSCCVIELLCNRITVNYIIVIELL